MNKIFVFFLNVFLKKKSVIDCWLKTFNPWIRAKSTKFHLRLCTWSCKCLFINDYNIYISVYLVHLFIFISWIYLLDFFGCVECFMLLFGWLLFCFVFFWNSFPLCESDLYAYLDSSLFLFFCFFSFFFFYDHDISASCCWCVANVSCLFELLLKMWSRSMAVWLKAWCRGMGGVMGGRGLWGAITGK